MKIGVYGGTFDPPHLGHLNSARFALETLELDKLLLMPAAAPPHKTLPTETAGVRGRWDMVNIAADGFLLPDRVEVSRLEMDRAGKSYTADTLALLREEYPKAKLWLLMGSDMFLTVQNWYKPEQIMSLASVAAFSRDAGDGDILAAHAKELRKTFGAKAEILRLPEIREISSTQLRTLLAADRAKAAEHLTPAVYGYILTHGLYGVHANLKALDDGELFACVCSMVKAKRIAHIKGVAEEAEKLALRWGADPVKARRAGILHDCTKYLEMDEHKALCARYGIELDALEQQAVKLLHSKTGAAIAKNVFGADDDIFWAIFWHTTGKADMTLLDKILYVADYMEPTRSFDGVDRMRELAYRDLDGALLMGLEMSVQEMEDRDLPVHRNTLEARDWMLKNGKGRHE